MPAIVQLRCNLPWLRRYEDTDTEIYAESHPFRLSRLSGSQSEHSEIGFDVSRPAAPRVVSPEEVGAQVLRHLMALTARVLGHTQVRRAQCMTVHHNPDRAKAATNGRAVHRRSPRPSLPCPPSSRADSGRPLQRPSRLPG